MSSHQAELLPEPNPLQEAVDRVADSLERHAGPTIDRLRQAPPASDAPSPPGVTSIGPWHHIPLGDEAELVISVGCYEHNLDRADWLVRWARKVFS